jgi:glycerol-3-phosphate dehydrogenase
MKTAAADVVIFGGGIAGLWLLARLQQLGLSAILFESGALGGGQTYKAQGIIHGGMKYALQGVFTKDAEIMGDIPEYWHQCLSGKGEIDLSAVAILSRHQYLWSPHKITSKLTGFLAGLTLSSKVETLNKQQYPSIFQHADFKGEVFSLNEIVLDVPSLVREFAKINQDKVFQIEPLSEDELKFDEQGQLHSATVYFAGKSVEVFAQHFIFTAGVGNEILHKKLKQKELRMQRRPLHMVLAKTPFDLPLYAHCLGLGNRPRITITTHYSQEGHSIWYLGGQLAEEGIEKNSQEQTETARKELQNLFPWLNFSAAELTSFIIDRAEPQQKNGMKPETFYAKTIHNMTLAWPTKLALAPKLANDVLQKISANHITAKIWDTRELRAWPMPPIAKPVWEEAFCKSVA